VVFEDWFSILEASIMSNPVVALPDVLEIAIYPTYLTLDFQSLLLLKDRSWVNDSHKKTIEEGTLGDFIIEDAFKTDNSQGGY
jgi:hypothetical protein